jgi:CAP-Gly domain-containing linker protein 3/4
VLKRGAHPDDRDSLTDMSLLMYGCKAGASGVGDVEAATKITTYLVERGCDLSARCRWTDMAALHYSTFFDVAPVLAILLHRTKGADVDTHCVEYESGTALHIAAANLSLGAARVLLKFGADRESTDDLGRKPVECVPDAASFELVPDAQELIGRMTKLLAAGLEDTARSPAAALHRSPSTKSISGRTVLQAMGLKVNDRVVVGSKLGTLRFCGTTEFSTGIWAGVELDNAEGRNDGTVKGMRYFHCEPGHGIFVAARAVAKAGSSYRPRETEGRSRPAKQVVHHGKVDVSHVQVSSCMVYFLGVMWLTHTAAGEVSHGDGGDR